jgi:hypothetical protein
MAAVCSPSEAEESVHQESISQECEINPTSPILTFFSPLKTLLKNHIAYISHKTGNLK